MRLPASRSASFTPKWKSTVRSARTHAPALRACVQIAPDRPSVAGTPADKRFGNGASDTSKINLKGVHQTGSTPHTEPRSGNVHRALGTQLRTTPAACVFRELARLLQRIRRPHLSTERTSLMAWHLALRRLRRPVPAPSALFLFRSRMGAQNPVPCSVQVVSSRCGHSRGAEPIRSSLVRRLARLARGS